MKRIGKFPIIQETIISGGQSNISSKNRTVYLNKNGDHYINWNGGKKKLTFFNEETKVGKMVISTIPIRSLSVKDIFK